MSKKEKEEAAKPSRRRKILSWIGQALILIVVVLVITEWQGRHLLSRSTAAPGFTLTSLDGDSVSLESARGKNAVIYFFAPWCSVCRYSSHNIRALREARSEDELAIFAVGLGYQSRSDVERFAREHELNVPVLLGNDAVMRRYNINSFPTIYIIDEDGRVQDRVIGYTTELGLRLRSL